jgi:hypothetical protein
VENQDTQTESPRESRKKRYRIRIAHPLQSINVINKVVKVLYNYKRSVSYKDIANACNMHPVNVSQALSAAHDIGLTALAGAKGLHVLTEDGKEYVRLLTSGKEIDASILLKKMLKGNPHWTEIVTFLNAITGESRDPIDLILEIERKSGKQWKTAMRNRLRDSLVSILEFAGLIVKEGSKITSVGDRGLPLEQLAEEEQAELPVIPQDRDFYLLKGDDFTFEVRKDLNAIEFAEKQFADWVAYLKKRLVHQESDVR